MKSLISLFFLSCCLFSFSAQAAYTCNDRDYLEQALAKLKSDCGGSQTSICESRGSKGSTPELAVKACIKNGYPESWCNEGLTCKGVALCQTRGSKGSTVESAVAACMKSGYPESWCNEAVTCEGISLCTSRGSKGSTVEKAVQACIKNGYPESWCNEGVSCN